MSNTSAPGEPGARTSFRIGDQLSRSLSLLGRHFWMLILLALPTAVLSAIFGTAMDFGAGTGQERVPPGAVTIIVATLVGVVVSFALYSLCQAMVVHAAVQAMRGRSVQLAETLSASLPRVVPVLLLSVISGILIMLASLALLIPGMMVMTMLFVSQPVCVVERRGPIASMSRSAELTKGHRWRVFGMILLIILIQAVIGLVLAALLRGAGSLAEEILTMAWNTLTMAFSAVVCAVVYHDLRILKEGVDIEQIAAVFG